MNIHDIIEFMDADSDTRVIYNFMRRLTYEYVKKYFDDNNCVLLESKYINSRYKMRYKCECGSIWETTFKDFKSGRRCGGCGIKKAAEKRRRKIEDVKDFFLKHKCVLLEKKYVNNKTPMKYRCSCGRIAKISFSSFKRGSRCKECGIKKNIGPNNPCWIVDKSKSLEKERIRKRYSKLVRNCLLYTGGKKNSKTEILLGYSPQEFRDAIFSHENWDEVKDGDWHIDHIFPIKAFVDLGITDLKVINALDNIRPLSARDNLLKGHDYDKTKFVKWLEKKGL